MEARFISPNFPCLSGGKIVGVPEEKILDEGGVRDGDNARHT